MPKLNPDMATAIIIFAYVFIAIMVVITILVALFFWELIKSFREYRKKRGLR